MRSDLIFDVGMNNGDDTAHYLHKGYRVVAVEADPTLVDEARSRFAEAVRDGRLQLVNAAVGPREEIAQFWICEGRSEWNSFDRQIAAREGRRHYAISVPCRRFRDLLAEYGTPFYLKVDIEGHDRYCIDDLDPGDLPRYVSMEMGTVEDLLTLSRLGYRRFKLITQNDHTQLQANPFGLEARVKRRLRPHPGLYRFAQQLAQVRRAGRARQADQQPAGAWQFPFGSSGPFGEDTDGPWQTLETVAHTWVAYQLGHSKYGPPSLDVWHDVHATTAEA